MGTKERRQREKKDQRQNILDAALQIINQEGFAALSMRKLAERIEYSLPPSTCTSAAANRSPASSAQSAIASSSIA
jgi:DNA-binding transcriptional regulator YbjK